MRSDRETIAAGVAEHQAVLFELEQHAVHGLPGKAHPRRDVRQPDGLRLVGNGLQDAQRLLECRAPLLAVVGLGH